MAVSKLLPSGGLNNFNIQITGNYTSTTLSKEFNSGTYLITSLLSDSTYDIYAFNNSGANAAYSNAGVLDASIGFNKIVILGGTIGDVISFEYEAVFVSSDTNDQVTAGPVITSVTPSSVPNIDNTFTVTGRNFANNVTVNFTGTGYTSTAAKNIVRTSATSLIVTRPDNLPPTGSPYTLTLQNPGVANPTGTNSHILSTSITSGVSPVWVTSATLPVFTKNVSYSQSVLATDDDAGSTISYSVVTDLLPDGLSFNTSTATISGTPTNVNNGSINIRATDLGGNFVDRSFTVPNVGTNAPVWATTDVPKPITGTAYTFTIVATDDSEITPVYSLQSGTLPTGLSFDAGTGVITGTSTDSTGRTIVFRATDTNGSFTDLTVTDYRVSVLTLTTFTASGTYTPQNSTLNRVALVGAGGAGGGSRNYGNCGSGGGGGGGVIQQSSISVTPGTSYSIIIGAGGVGASTQALSDANVTPGGMGRVGGNTTAFGLTAYGGDGGTNSGNGPAPRFLGPGGGGASYAFGKSDPATGTSGTFIQGGYGKGCDNNAVGGGGASSTNFLTFNSTSTGRIGFDGPTLSINGQGVGGGGSSGSRDNGGASANSTGGGAGAGGVNSTGGNATLAGGGGGGCGADSLDPSYNSKGGSGFRGVVVVEEYL